MGGTYWYFVSDLTYLRPASPLKVSKYRLNGEIEYHNSFQPSTTACPLLPGQQVNVLDVPIQICAPMKNEYNSSTSSIEKAAFTMDPQAKYVSPRPSVRKSALPQSDSALYVDAQWSTTQGDVCMGPSMSVTTLPNSNRTNHLVSHLQPPRSSQGFCISFRKPSSLVAAFHRKRGFRSADSVIEPQGKRGNEMDEPSKPWPANHPRQNYGWAASDFSPRNRIRAPVNTPEWPTATSEPPPVTPWIAFPSIADQCEEITPAVASDLSFRSTWHSTNSLPVSAKDHVHNNQEGRGDTSSTQSCYLTPSEEQHDYQSFFLSPSTAPPSAGSVVSTNQRLVKGDQSNASVNTNEIISPLMLPIQSNVPSPRTLANEPAETRIASGAKKSIRPLILDHNPSPALVPFIMSPSTDGQSSPNHLSQPESPSVRDFEEDWDAISQSLSLQEDSRDRFLTLGHATDDLSSGFLGALTLGSPRFQGYSLPKDEYASAQTICKPPSSYMTPTQKDIPFHKTGEHDLVSPWDDGSDQRHITALDELVDDLGYLGRVIT